MLVSAAGAQRGWCWCRVGCGVICWEAVAGSFDIMTAAEAFPTLASGQPRGWWAVAVNVLYRPTVNFSDSNSTQDASVGEAKYLYHMSKIGRTNPNPQFRCMTYIYTVQLTRVIPESTCASYWPRVVLCSFCTGSVVLCTLQCLPLR